MAKILLIDDDPDILKFGAAVLQSQNHRVFQAANGDQAMDLIESEELDLIFCDVNMPHISGFDLLETIRSQPKFRNLPLALLTGRREVEDVTKAIKLGVSDYIVKPIQPDLLVEKTNSLLNAQPRTPTSINFDGPFVPLGDVVNEIRVVTLSDIDVTLESSTDYKIGTIHTFTSTVFTQMRIEKTKICVTSCKDSENEGKYLVRGKFVDISDRELRRITSWIKARLSERESAKESVKKVA